MKTAVFAYHNMGILGLDALVRHEFDVPLVFTHADDPEENRWFGSVARWCDEQGVKYVVYDDLDAGACSAMLEQVAPDFVFSFYFRKLLKKDLLKVPCLGALNLHGSLLPKYRGRAPVNWVLVNGEKETGVTLHYMVEKPDAGDIVDQEAASIADDDTAFTLFGKLEKAAIVMLDRALPLLREGKAGRIPQDDAAATYFGRRRPGDGLIDCGKGAGEIYNLIRAVTRPYPGAFTHIDGKKLVIWRAEVVGESMGLAVGELREEAGGMYIGTGQGALRITDFEWM